MWDPKDCIPYKFKPARLCTFARKVFEAPYAPHFHKYEGHTFEILSERDGHYKLLCHDNNSVIVDGIVDTHLVREFKTLTDDEVLRMIDGEVLAPADWTVWYDRGFDYFQAVHPTASLECGIDDIRLVRFYEEVKC